MTGEYSWWKGLRGRSGPYEGGEDRMGEVQLKLMICENPVGNLMPHKRIKIKMNEGTLCGG